MSRKTNHFGRADLSSGAATGALTGGRWKGSNSFFSSPFLRNKGLVLLFLVCMIFNPGFVIAQATQPANSNSSTSCQCKNNGICVDGKICLEQGNCFCVHPYTGAHCENTVFYLLDFNRRYLWGVCLVLVIVVFFLVLLFGWAIYSCFHSDGKETTAIQYGDIEVWNKK